MDLTETNGDILMADPRPATEEQKKALAKMFSDVDMRSYLVHAIQVANKNAVSYIKSNKLDLAKESANRAEALEALLNQAKLFYIHFDKLLKS